ncbi:hypothetical protein HYW20_02610 [Candidatus Woesearchaeota archaeon]|nr:hypothetical protein [Candidatus Woesearchaeota archaeon]
MGELIVNWDERQVRDYLEKVAGKKTNTGAKSRNAFFLSKQYFTNKLSEKQIRKIGYELGPLRIQHNYVMFRLINDMEKGTLDKDLVENDFKKSLEDCINFDSVGESVNVLRLDDFDVKCKGGSYSTVHIGLKNPQNTVAKGFLYVYANIVLPRWTSLKG